MHLILHIGTEKTGTTTFQNWCAANRDMLREQKVFYSRVLGQANHMLFYLYCIDPSDNNRGFNLVGLNDPYKRADAMAAVPQALAIEVAEAHAAGCTHFLISNEHCQSHLNSVEQVARAHALVTPLFEKQTVFCAVRPQIDMVASRASTAARAGMKVTPAYFDSAHPTQPFYNFRDLAKRWSEVFGKQDVHFYPFARNLDTVAYFSARLGIETSGMTPPPRQNEALDVRVIALLNRYVDESGLRPRPFAPAIRNRINALPILERLNPGLEIAKSAQSRFMQSNAQFVEEHPSVTLADLEPDWKRYAGEGNLSLLTERQDEKIMGPEALYKALDKLSF